MRVAAFTALVGLAAGVIAGGALIAAATTGSRSHLVGVSRARAESTTGTQQAVDSAPAAAYAVSYVEVRQSSEHAAIDALRAYREASQKETGWIGTQLLAQLGRPGHFATIESWTDAGALEAHDRATSTRQLADTLEPIRTSEYDRRPYKPLTMATPLAPAGDEAVVVVSHVDTLPSPQSDAAGLLRELAAQSRLDAGNLLFNVVQHAARANHFTVIEIWRDRAAQQAHTEAPHVRRYRDDLKAISGSPLDERLFTSLR